jgi:alkaline phosphatase
MRTKTSLSLCTIAGVLCAGSASFAQTGEAKNVILLISDGIGFNGWEASSFFNYADGLPYDTDDFTFYGQTNHNAFSSFDPASYWSDFSYQDRGATDSAAAGTALVTGEKTFGGAISVDVDGNPLVTIGEIAAGLGKATGAVSSVQYNHATPAVVDAHNTSRNNYAAIAADMISSDLDVIMGGDSRSPGQQIYTDAAGAGFTVIQGSDDPRIPDDPADWNDLADGDGTFRGGTMPTKLFGGFSGATLGGRSAPTLETMTKGALAVLEQDEDGLFLMVEGGAVDWENHGNDMNDMLREQLDFDNAVMAAVDWVERESSWDETLLIVTSDHETGSIWGPTEDAYNNVVDNGVGNLPGFSYNSGNHTNALVPLWARGPGADGFDALVDGVDAQGAAFWTQFGGTNGWNGSFIDNTDVFTVMNASMIPEPATASLLGLAGLAMLRRTRRA